nr:efflux RND transporter periplasmic adaptor subunit [Pseudenhygromyxa sp. WMMC2535]
MLALATSCTSGKASPEPEPEPEASREAPPTVPESAVQTAAKVEVPTWIVTTGSLVAHDRSEVVPNVPGKVIEVLVERGDHVEADDPLVRLDVRDAKISAREAKANLAGLEAARELADKTCARTEKLAERGAVSSADVERETANCRQAEENVRAAKERARAAAKSVTDGLIRAPFAGTVGERAVSIGEWANLGTPIVTLVEDGPLRAELELSEAASVHVALGTKVEVSPVALPELALVAEVTRVAPDLDPSSRTRVVEVELPPNPELIAGMFVRAKVITGSRELAAVPRTAVVERGTSPRVFVAVEGVVEERLVVLGPELEGERVGIARGLEPGEMIVAEGVAEVRDGQVIH